MFDSSPLLFRLHPTCRYISGGLVSMMLDLANFTAAPITLRGLEERDISMLHSAFWQRIMQAG